MVGNVILNSPHVTAFRFIYVDELVLNFCCTCSSFFFLISALWVHIQQVQESKNTTWRNKAPNTFVYYIPYSPPLLHTTSGSLLSHTQTPLQLSKRKGRSGEYKIFLYNLIGWLGNYLTCTGLSDHKPLSFIHALCRPNYLPKPSKRLHF